MELRNISLVCRLITVVLCLASSVRAEESVPLRTGWLDVQFYSINPTKGLDSYRPDGKGGAGLGGTFSASVDANGAELDISVSARQQNGKLLADLKTQRQAGGEATAPPELNREVDVTDLAPVTYELGRDLDGRVHRMTIVPSLKSHPLPRQFRVGDLDLTDFNLGRLPVILNEQEFIGAAGVSGGEVISLQIAGLADIEFSLSPFPGAVHSGELNNGILVIRHEKTYLQISGVTHGTRNEVLQGGPYKIFVRWEAPAMTLAQYVNSLEFQLKEFRKLAAQGDLRAKLVLPQFETMAANLTAAAETKSRTACLYGSGARQLSKKERESGR